MKPRQKKQDPIFDERLWEIRIRSTCMADWQRLVGFLRRTDAELVYELDGLKTTLPQTIDTLFSNGDHTHLLIILLGGFGVLCDLSTPSEIGLMLDLTMIDSDAKARTLFRVMSTLGRRLDKAVYLVPCSAKEYPAFEYHPGSGLICHVNEGKEPLDTIRPDV